MKRVLIVDDEKEIRSIFEEIFRYDLNFDNITFAKDGLEADRICAHQKFDLITLDHMMPKVRGADFLVALRSKSGINQTTPVIMISAHSPGLSESIKAVTNTYFMDKPVDFRRLASYVKMSMEQR
ncbi:MAG: response regulator [Bacteriovorax sp.]